MKDDNYITIQGWMVNRLNLSGNELMVYAIIYGFSQDGESVYEGSGQYLADSIGISRRAVSIILNNLLEKKYIRKIDFSKNNVKYCNYKANLDILAENVSNRGMEKISIGRKNIPQGGYGKNFHTLEKDSIGCGNNCHEGMEKDSNHITNTNLNNTAATASGKSEPDEKPLPTVENAAAALSPEELKKQFLAADNRLIFDSAFYNKALVFMADKSLEIKYIPWLRDKCEKKDYRDFKSLYYSLFFNDSFAEEYLLSTAAEEKKVEKPAKPHVCPACNTALGTTDKECPECKLSTDFPSPEQIELHKELIKLKPDKRNEYLNREDKIYSECKKDFVKIKQNIKNLKHEYGLVTS